MASIILTLSSVRNKKTNKSEILLRYRNTRKVALRAHTHIYVLPEFFSDGQIVINKRRETEEVKEARAANTKLDAMITLLEEKGSKMDIDDIGPAAGRRTSSTASSSRRTTRRPIKSTSASMTRLRSSSSTRNSLPNVYTLTRLSSAS